MGMFDWINATVACPACGHGQTGFQSKDGPCTLDGFTPEELLQWVIDNTNYFKAFEVPEANFYSGCDSCGHWIEVKITPAPVKYEVT